MMNVASVVPSSCCCKSSNHDNKLNQKNKVFKRKPPNEASVSRRERMLVDCLNDEYISLTPEQFSTYKEYQDAKQVSYERLQDAMSKYHQIIEEADTNNANNFEKIMNSVTSFFGNIGGKALHIGAKFLFNSDSP